MFWFNGFGIVPNIIGSHYTSMLLGAHIWDTLWSPKHPTKWGVHILGCPLWPLSFIRHDCQWHQYFNTILDLCAWGCPSFGSHNLQPTSKLQHYFHYAYEFLKGSKKMEVTSLGLNVFSLTFTFPIYFMHQIRFGYIICDS
jgi:hypothetical protein